MANGDKRASVGGYRTSVWTLAVWVVGAAIYLALARGATGFWEPMGPTSRRLDVDRATGFVLLAPTILVGARLVVEVARRAGGCRGLSTFGLVWRGVGAAFLAWVGVETSTGLATPRDSDGSRVFASPDALRMSMVGLAMTIGLVGLLLGMTPGRANRRAPHPEGRWRGAARIVASGAIGVLLLAAWGMTIPYLVLLAMEAVRNAMTRPGLVASLIQSGGPIDPILIDRSLWPSLPVRIARAGLAAAIALVSCGLTAGWLGRDLRSDPRLDAPRSAAGTTYRAVTTVLTWVLGAFLLLDTLPRLQPSLAEGLWTILGPTARTLIVASFAVLAAGIAARGIGDHFEIDVRSTGRLLRLLRMAISLILAVVVGMLVLATVSQIRGDEVHPWYVLIATGYGLGMVRSAFTVASPITSTGLRTNYFDPGESPGVLVVLAALAWIIPASIRLLIAGREAPVDRVGRSPRLIARFVGAWLAILGVILTLLPALALAGLAVYVSVRAFYP